jgi:hypothetical protein
MSAVSIGLRKPRQVSNSDSSHSCLLVRSASAEGCFSETVRFLAGRKISPECSGVEPGKAFCPTSWLSLNVRLAFAVYNGRLCGRLEFMDLPVCNRWAE